MKRYRFIDESEDEKRRKEKNLELRQAQLALKEREIAAKEERNRLREKAIKEEKAKERAIKLRKLLNVFSPSNAIKLIGLIIATTASLVFLLRQLAEHNTEAARVYISLSGRLSRTIEAVVNGSSSAVSRARETIDAIIHRLGRDGGNHGLSTRA